MPQKLLSEVFSRDVVLTILAAMVFMAFKKPIEGFITKNFVSSFLYTLEGEWYNDVSFFLLTIAHLLVSWFYAAGRRTWAFPLFIAFAYTCYRCNAVATPWSFEPLHFSTFSFLNYADLLYLPFLGVVASFTSRQIPSENHEQSKDTATGGFLYDAPLTSGKTDIPDILGYTNYALKLIDRIKETKGDSAFAIGVTGKWGTGKSTFLKIIECELKKDNSFINVEFNPWQSPSSEAMIEDFFNTFREEVTPPIFTPMSKAISEYVEKLNEIEDSTLMRSLKAISNIFWKPEPIQSIRERIESSIPKGKKIIVYIDDVDRLDNERIAALVKLIRLTANFENTYFLVAYDRNYLTNALRHINPTQNEIYLEKIFQLEITLPYFEKRVLIDHMTSMLISKFPELKNEIENALMFSEFSNIIYNTWLNNMRDVVRVVNAVYLNLKGLESDVDLSDFIPMQILLVKYPAIYELLYRKELELFDSGSKSLKINENKKSLVYNLLENNPQAYSVKDEDIDVIESFLTTFFPIVSKYPYKNRTHLSIVHASKFSRYFPSTLKGSDISNIEFSRARDETKEQFFSKISSWVNDGKSKDDLLEKFITIKDFDDQTDFEKVIGGLVYICKILVETKKPESLWRGQIDGACNYLFGHLIFPENKFLNRIYQEKEEDAKLFTQALFENPSNSFEFEFFFFSTLRIHEYYAYNFLLNRSDIMELFVKYFEQYTSKHPKLDKVALQLFAECQNINEEESAIITHPKAVAIMRTMIEEDLEAYLRLLIIRRNLDVPGEERYSLKNDCVLPIFDSMAKFEEFLSKQIETEFIKEFIEFLSEYAKHGNEKPIWFAFSVIHPDM